MATCYPYLFFLLWLTYLMVSSIGLFSWGYFNQREVLNYNSTCVPIEQLLCPGVDKACSNSDKIAAVVKQYEIAHNLCLPPHSRVVLLLIDALRYDFITFDSTIENPLPYQNKMPVIQNMLDIYPNSSRIYRFVADPPTVTLQRLKALTTGNLPTFIEAGSNFASAEIADDNILDQLNTHNFNSVFLGDDTWKHLFPDRFKRSYFHPSFQIYDLDTVDKKIKQDLFVELDKKDWHLLVAHFLGVDHCGHRHGPNHAEMTRKLTEMNDVIDDVIDNLEDDMVLFVIGDHGMTATGDHSGSSELETNAGMFVFSHRPLWDFSAKDNRITQINLVPTLATILGIPIPFQNLGILIADAIPVTEVKGVEQWQLALFKLWSNIQQIVDYIKLYDQNTKTFAKGKLSPIFEKYGILRSKIHSLHKKDKVELFYQELVDLTLRIKTMCEEVFIQFEPFLMARGLLLLFMSIFFTFLLTDGIPFTQFPDLFNSPFLIVLYSSAAATFTVIFVFYMCGIIQNLMSVTFFGTGVISQLMLLILLVQNWSVISLHWEAQSRIQRYSNLMCRAIFMFNILTPFSNSFIVEEAYILIYLTGSTIILIGIECMHKRKLRKHIIIFLILVAICLIAVRAVSYFWACREEQKWCFVDVDATENTKKEATKVEWLVNVVLLAVFLILLRRWLKNCGNLNGFSVTVLFTKILPNVILICVAGYWVLRKMPRKPVRLNSINYLAHSAYILIALGITSVIWKPLCIYILPKESDITVQTHQNIIPQLYNKLKNYFEQKTARDDENAEEVPIVCGFATVYSATFIVFGSYLILLISLLLGDIFSASMVVMVCVAVICIFLTAVIRIERAKSVEQLLDVPNIVILLWLLLSQYSFFASHHQPTFPSIQWEAAFVGTSGEFATNVIPGFLIIVNTFCSQIFFGMMLPLVVIAPFTIFIMMPSIITKKPEFRLVIPSGEVTLYEKDEYFFAAMFAASGKYLAGYGIKVFVCMLAATIHCRHLMAWKIFAPKFIFESIGFFVTLVSVICGYLLLIRVNNVVEKLVIKLNKRS